MEKNVGNEESDALLATARAAAVKPAETLNEASTVAAYNFSRGGQISNEQMRAIATSTICSRAT